MDKRKIGRDARTDKFITVAEARRRKNTADVETIKFPQKRINNLGFGTNVIIPLVKSAAGQSVLTRKAAPKKQRTL